MLLLAAAVDHGQLQGSAVHHRKANPLFIPLFYLHFYFFLYLHKIQRSLVKLLQKEKLTEVNLTENQLLQKSHFGSTSQFLLAVLKLFPGVYNRNRLHCTIGKLQQIV